MHDFTNMTTSKKSMETLQAVDNELKKMRIAAQERDNEQFLKHSIIIFSYIGKIISLFGIPDITFAAEAIRTVIDFL
jgi:3-deoxy-D-manno-octulosonic-acid transferase